MSKRMKTVAFWGLILITVGPASPRGDAQGSPTETFSHVSSDAYEHILDEVFAYKKPETRRLEYSLVLRFMTSKHAESEIVLFVPANGNPSGTFFQVSGPSVWTIANNYVQKTGNANVQQIVKQVHVTRHALPMSQGQAQDWYSGLLMSIGRSVDQFQREMVALKTTGKTTIFLDGSTYELWFDQGSTSIHWSAMDEEVDDVHPAGYAPIARWMNGIRRYAISHPGK